MEKIYELDGRSLSLAEIVAVAVDGGTVSIARTPIHAWSLRAVWSKACLRRGETAYGINTGFGKLSDVRIGPDQLEALQRNLVRSHACGLGEPLPEDEVRAMLLLRANVLAKGLSGVRPLVVETWSRC